jgi:hypothetical protein
MQVVIHPFVNAHRSSLVDPDTIMRVGAMADPRRPRDLAGLEFDKVESVYIDGGYARISVTASIARQRLDVWVSQKKRYGPLVVVGYSLVVGSVTAPEQVYPADVDRWAPVIVGAAYFRWRGVIRRAYVRQNTLVEVFATTGPLLTRRLRICRWLELGMVGSKPSARPLELVDRETFPSHRGPSALTVRRARKTSFDADDLRVYARRRLLIPTGSAHFLRIGGLRIGRPLSWVLEKAEEGLPPVTYGVL